MVNSYTRYGSSIIVEAESECLDLIKPILVPYYEIQENVIHEQNLWSVTLNGKIEGGNNITSFLLKQSCEPDINVYFDEAARKINLFIDNTLEWKAQNILRMIRVLSRLMCRDKGFIYLHGGMIQYEGKGICFLGNKKAGKTSSILSMLKSFHAKFISNDDISVHQDGNFWKADGWPRSVAVREDTIEKLGLKFFENLTHPLNTISEVNEVCLYPNQLVERLSCEMIESCTVDYVVFPEFVGGNNVLVKQLTPKEAKNQLLQNIMNNPGKFNEYLLPSFKSNSKSSVEEKIMNLLKNVTCISLKQSFDNLPVGSHLLADYINRIL